MFKTIHISNEQHIYYSDVRYDRSEKLLELLQSNGSDLNRLQSMTNSRRKSEWMTIREILIKTLGKGEDIVYDSQNKPHLKISKKHISISHSHHRVAIHISTKESPGVDLQVVNSKIIRIKPKFLNELEQNNTTKDIKQLTAYWSIKEALFKIYGTNDAFLKQNFEVQDFKFNGISGAAIGKIKTKSMNTSIPMQFKMIDDYMLAYNVIS